jgi:hypothetical protein
VNDPDTCQHDFKRVFPRHVTGQVPTSPGGEQVLAVVCCGCGKSPLYFDTLRYQGRNRPETILPSGDWPEHLVITDYEWGNDFGPSVEFRER